MGLKIADKTDELIKDAKDELARARKEVAALAEDVDEGLESWVTLEIKKLEGKLSKYDPRIAKAVGLSTRLRDDAKKKEAEELYTIEQRALKIIKYHQRVRQLRND